MSRTENAPEKSNHRSTASTVPDRGPWQVSPWGFDEVAGRIFDDLNVWINVLDVDMTVSFWNRVAERLSGYRAEEVLGNPKMWEWIYPDDTYRQAVMERSRGILQDRETISGFQTELVCRDGKKRCFSWNARPLVTPDGAALGTLVVGNDVTELQRSREGLRSLNEELSILYDVASVASESLELSTILVRCLKRILHTFPAATGLVHVANSPKGKLKLAASVGTDDMVSDSSIETITRGAIERIFAEGKPLLLDRVSQPKGSPPEPREEGQSFVGVPLRAKGRVFGVFSLIGHQLRESEEKDMALLTSLGDQIGLTIDHARLQKQAEQVAVFQERSRLARELHDSVSQSLYSLTLFAEASRRHLGRGELPLAEDRLDRLAQTAQETFREMRLLVHELRPLELEREGFLGALKHRVEAVERRAGVEVDFNVDPNLELPVALEEVLYQIAREALNNTFHHAAAQKVAVSVQAIADRVRLQITDDGIGFDPTEASRQGLGLLGIRERAGQAGGKYQIDSKPGRGTTIWVEVPLEEPLQP